MIAGIVVLEGIKEPSDSLDGIGSAVSCGSLIGNRVCEFTGSVSLMLMSLSVESFSATVSWVPVASESMSLLRGLAPDVSGAHA